MPDDITMTEPSGTGGARRSQGLDERPTDAQKMVAEARHLLGRMADVLERTDRDLAHASGALADIEVMVTSGVSQSGPEDLQHAARHILERILSSDHQPHRPPSWCRHQWERDLWAKYLQGRLPSAGHVEGGRRHPVPETEIPPLRKPFGAEPEANGDADVHERAVDAAHWGEGSRG